VRGPPPVLGKAIRVVEPRLRFSDWYGRQLFAWSVDPSNLICETWGYAFLAFGSGHILVETSIKSMGNIQGSVVVSQADLGVGTSFMVARSGGRALGIPNHSSNKAASGSRNAQTNFSCSISG